MLCVVLLAYAFLRSHKLCQFEKSCSFEFNPCIEKAEIVMELALNAPLLFEVQQLYSPHGTKIPEFIFHHPSLDSYVDIYWLLFSVKNDIFAVQILRETTNSVKT